VEPVEEGEVAPPRKEVTYFAGRLNRDGDQWLYESYGHVFTSEQYPDIGTSLSTLYRDTRREFDSQHEQLKQAKEALVAK
jgi:hypothetical protein